MMFRKATVVSVAGITLAILSRSGAHAAPIATFTTVDSSTNKFQFVPATSLSHPDNLFTSSPINVLFNFDSSLGITNGSGIQATLVVTADVFGPATLNGGSGNAAQNLQNLTLHFYDSHNKNLLSVISGSGVNGSKLQGTNNGTLPALSGNNSLGNTFTFTSDFLTFGSPASENYRVGLKTLNTTPFKYVAATSSTPAHLQGFSAITAGGNFNGSASAIPEASTLVGFGTMLTGGVFTCLKRRKKA